MGDITSNVDLNAIENIVHPDWELIDPTPDISALAKKFNGYFFENRLPEMKFAWSKKMINCAGNTELIGDSIKINLSEALLRYQSRKSTIDTLLHEMIHAYLHVTNQPNGHGIAFQRKMKIINDMCGTNIVIKHHFKNNDPVFFYRCVGPCRSQPPDYGWFKSAYDRPPLPKWNGHAKKCDGFFIREYDSRKAFSNSDAPIDDKAIIDPDSGNTVWNVPLTSQVVASKPKKSRRSEPMLTTATEPHDFLLNGSTRRRSLPSSLTEDLLQLETPFEADEELNEIDSEVPVSDQMFANYHEGQEKLLSIAFLGYEPVDANNKNVCILCQQFVQDMQIYRHLFECTGVSAMQIQYELPFYRIPSAVE